MTNKKLERIDLLVNLLIDLGNALVEGGHSHENVKTKSARVKLQLAVAG